MCSMVHSPLSLAEYLAHVCAKHVKPSETASVPWFCPARSVISYDSTLKYLLSGRSVNELLASAGIHFIIGLL